MAGDPTRDPWLVARDPNKMLPKENRLTKEKEIGQVYQNGQNFHGQFIGLKVLKNKLLISRFCFVVSNKIAPKAVRRNRIKRQLREIIRLKLGRIKPGTDCLIIAKKGVTELEYKQMEEEMIGLLKKARLLN